MPSRDKQSDQVNGSSLATAPQTGPTKWSRRLRRSIAWIRLLSLPSRCGRSFAAVVHNTEAGVKALTRNDYHYLGLLDADLDFQSDYFETLIRRFDANPRLGLAGGVVMILAGPGTVFPGTLVTFPALFSCFVVSASNGWAGWWRFRRGMGLSHMRNGENEWLRDTVGHRLHRQII